MLIAAPVNVPRGPSTKVKVATVAAPPPPETAFYKVDFEKKTRA